ncbi:uncharacterized protein ACRADG_009803 isoform 1-T1 [Cochliomyia hominivorax]
MKFLLLISSICALVITSKAAVARGFFGDPGHPGKCVIENIILSPGEVAQFPKSPAPIQNSIIPIGCGRIICYHATEVEFHTCGLVLPPPGYKLGEPVTPTADYPKCCKRAFVPIK